MSDAPATQTPTTADEAPIVKPDTKPSAAPAPTPQLIVPEQSPTLGKLAGALAKAQGTMKNAEKTRENKHLGNSYADLASVWDACRDALSTNGLALVQQVLSSAGKAVAVRTALIHESGEYMAATFVVQSDSVGSDRNSQIHRLGSAITYARRYTLAAMVGVAVGDEDDDGVDAGRGQPNGRRETPEAPDTSTPRKKALALLKQWSGLPGEDTGEAVRQIVHHLKLPAAVNGKYPDDTLEKVAKFIEDQLADEVDFTVWAKANPRS